MGGSESLPPEIEIMFLKNVFAFGMGIAIPAVSAALDVTPTVPVKSAFPETVNLFAGDNVPIPTFPPNG